MPSSKHKRRVEFSAEFSFHAGNYLHGLELRLLSEQSQQVQHPHLARLELRLMLDELLDRMPEMEVCGEVTRLHSTLVAGHEEHAGAVESSAITIPAFRHFARANQAKGFG